MAPSNDETRIVFPDGEGGPEQPKPEQPRADPSADTAADTSREFELGADVEPGLTAADQATVEALHDNTALLLVQRGPTSGARFLLDAEVTTVGRSPGNDIFLDDVTVSRKHAEFRRSGHTFSVRDVGSLNGTYVGRERIDGEATLRSGDEVQVGKFRFLFQQAAQPSAPPGGSSER
jgi:pSer/pThr/pTyr-binding forkhead associated (FHA) protein